MRLEIFLIFIFSFGKAEIDEQGQKNKTRIKEKKTLKKTSIYQIVRLEPPALDKSKAIDFDRNNIWHIEAFVGSIKFHDKIKTGKNALGNVQRK